MTFRRLEEAGATVEYHDPHIPVIRPSREHGHFAGRRSVALDPETVADFDAVLLLTRHAAMDLKPVAEAARLIVDTRNAVAAFGLPPERWVKASASSSWRGAW